MDNIYQEKITYSRWQNSWHAFNEDLLGKIGAYFVLALLLLSVFGDLLSPYSINEQFLESASLPPIWNSEGNLKFVLGTDDLGRDILSRLMSGVSATFGSALLISLIVFLVGLFLSLSIALGQRVRAIILNHLLDILLSIPSLLLAIIFVAFMEASLFNAMLAVGLALLPRLTVTLFDAISKELENDYVTALRLDGADQSFIIKRIVLPNVSHLLVGELTRTCSLAILDISALGFLGLGAQLPTPEWGAMIGYSIESFYIAPWTVMLPGAAIFIAVLAVNLFGFGLSRAIIKGVS